MPSAWTAPFAMLSTASFPSALLVNKLQVNRAAQHFSDLIPLFLNTAQMWLAHQPDYLQKDSRRQLPDSFKSLKTLLRLKKASTAHGNERRCRGLLLHFSRGAEREKLHHHTCLSVSPQGPQLSQRTAKSAPFFGDKGTRNSLKCPRLASCAAFCPLLTNCAFTASCLLSQTLVRAECSRPVWAMGRHMFALQTAHQYFQRYSCFYRPEIRLFWIQWADTENIAQHLHFHLGNGEEIWTDIWESH